MTKTYGRLDLLFNNAGLAEPDPNATPSTVSVELASKILAINTLAPIELTKAFLPLLKSTLAFKEKALVESLSSSSSSDTPNPSTSTELKSQLRSHPLVRVVYVSSSMASIRAVANATAPSYRASKAALNMYVRCFAFEAPDIAFLLLHPGWVQTDMGSRGNRTPPLDVVTSIKKCLGVINKMSLDKSATAIESFDGTTWPW